MESRSEVMIKKQIIKDILLSGDLKTKLETKKHILFGIIPELSAEEDFDQKHPHHCYDAWQHTVVALSHSKPDFEIRTALLLHDIAKPFCYQEDYNILHFKGHPEKGAEMAKKILTDLQYSEKEIEDICYLIKNHDTVIDVNNLDNMNLNLVDKLLHIQYCDAYAHHPDHIQKRIEILDDTKKQIENYKIQKKEALKEKNDNENER